MQADYKPFIDRLIHSYEGGYGWNKKDPGGPTNFGITCYDLAEHRGKVMNSMADWAPLVKAMTLSEAEDIYRTKYAARLAFDNLNAGCDTVILDYGVNSGIERAIRVTRALVGQKGSNTLFDAALVHAVNATDPSRFISAMDKERLSFMHAIRGGAAWAEFGKGWQRRVDDLDAYSKHLVTSGATAPLSPDLTNVPTPKAINPPPKSSTTGGLVASPPIVAAAHEAGVPWYGALAAGLGIIVAGTAYEIYQAIKANNANQKVHA